MKSILSLVANKTITVKAPSLNGQDDCSAECVKKISEMFSRMGRRQEYSSILGSISYVRIGEDKPSISLLKEEARTGLGVP